MPFVLSGADGGPLRGDVRAAGNAPRPAVVICHGFKGFKDWGFFPPLADRLARAGFTAVSFNFSGSGVGADGDRFDEPERFGHATLGGDLADLATVLRALRAGELRGAAPVTRLGLFGHSRGGGVSLLQAASDREVRALVTWSAIGTAHRWGKETVARWRAAGRLDVTNQRTGQVLPLYLDALDELDADVEGRLDLPAAAARVSCPWLQIHGEADETVPVAEAKRLHRHAAAGSRFITVPRGSHTFGARHPWGGVTRELELAMDQTVGWFTAYLVE
ncbi:MAG TPA: alpha/beta fold hydrolase [Gemmatimonadales bacterium]|nr:alpha/beta fold hydrolase [Gemmatimonadales bacterium]